VFSGQVGDGTKDTGRKTAEHFVKLAISLCRGGCDDSRPSDDKVDVQTGGTATPDRCTAGELASIDFPGGEHVKFGSISWESKLHYFSTFGGR
jgi:hypothetical protein